MIMKGAEFGKALAVHGADAPDSEKKIAAWAAECRYTDAIDDLLIKFLDD